MLVNSTTNNVCFKARVKIDNQDVLSEYAKTVVKLKDPKEAVERIKSIDSFCSALKESVEKDENLPNTDLVTIRFIKKAKDKENSKDYKMALTYQDNTDSEKPCLFDSEVNQPDKNFPYFISDLDTVACIYNSSTALSLMQRFCNTAKTEIQDSMAKLSELYDLSQKIENLFQKINSQQTQSAGE